MNHLESKTLKIVKAKLDKALVGVMDLKARIGNINNDTIPTTLKSTLMADCNKIMDDHLKEINEWLHALEDNKT